MAPVILDTRWSILALRGFLLISDLFIHPLGAYLWLIALHSLIAAALLYSWSRRLHLPSGRLRRELHVIILCTPLLTAAVPVIVEAVSGERWAIFDSHRLLVLPLPGPFRVYHGVLMIGLVTVFVSLWQELLPLWRRAREASVPTPDELLTRVRELPGWSDCRVEVHESEGLEVATTGTLARPHLIISEHALDHFEPAELEAVLHHENAHWRRGRWRATHLLYGARLLQIFNPIALWVFREYVVESEIDCDRDAAAMAGKRPLARALLAVYRQTARGDLASRTILRKRIDVLTEKVAFEDEPIPRAVLGLTIAILLGALPWVV